MDYSKSRRVFSFGLIFFYINISYLVAQAGLDPTFGQGGSAINSIGTLSDFVESINGFMFFTDPSKYIAWTTGTGIVIGPLHTHLVYAIAGMYFGNGSVK